MEEGEGSLSKAVGGRPDAMWVALRERPYGTVLWDGVTFGARDGLSVIHRTLVDTNHHARG